jgi:hypothetical protein
VRAPAGGPRPTPPPPPRPAAAAATARARGAGALEGGHVRVVEAAERPVLDDVDAVERERDTVVVVTLSFRGRRVVGTRRSGHASTQVDRAASEATLEALAQVVPPRRVEWHVDRTEVLGPATAHRPAVVHGAIAVRTARGEEMLVGAALVRTSTYDAAARATLDAVNRRLDQLVVE